MYKRFLTFVFALFFATLAHAEMRVVNSPGDGFLNLRTGPGGQYDIILQMPHGSTVETLEIAGKWARVRHETGAMGWAFRKYMDNVPAALPRLYVYSPGDGYLNLRTGPGSSYAIITRMFNDEWVEILERKGNWVRVFHQDGDEGWAYAKYLRN